MRSTERSVLVTGGGKRLGAQIVRRLADDGWTVVVHYRSSADAAISLAGEVGGLTVQTDLKDAVSAARLIEKTNRMLDVPLTALVNSASVFEYDDLASMTPQTFQHHQDTNVLAPVLLSRALYNAVRENSDGAVVNLLDQKLENLNPDFFSYTISKGALEMATRLMARAYAPRLRINGVAPGICLPSGDQTQAEFEAVAGRYNLMRRPIALGDIASTVSFLLDMGAVTGQTIFPDNGQHAVSSDQDVMFTTRGHRR